MLIPVQNDEEGTVPEWALIELQGTFESLTGSDIITDIGILSKSAIDKDIIHLVIGYHQLEGRRQTLKKPLLILDKQKIDAALLANMAEQSLHSLPHGLTRVKYSAVGIVRSKILFKTRPTALISKPSAGHAALK
ncbi:hypothetical protein CEUSTIGMA_g1005.t1 [Chlamydomonas eustigma]|uniref:Chromosome transmission fidelity protein 8 n=1 Tax=Chlamydomonas eustigma TaxID=1157962 RepID=A0A250WRT1_9CHLO|nr:hypothetical protein CEUSTIGMA_g1005.t1 [Chlamydomonas eustigma]|eukprot:GAX73554.1 hypothetical protein CEUSTIGMA_g1005.t1 [Chlamydomonas eustigma]